MPTYEYACRSCNQHIEVVQSFRDDPLQECGQCGGALRKVFSAAGIIFKGSGYYVTDTRAAQSSNGATKSSKSSSSDGDSSESGSTSKGSGESSSSDSSSPSDSSSSRGEGAAKKSA